ncbi:hypothetical protein EOD07_07495 [Mesorhizobium sp. M2C.T.Ca.TU.002.02.1.1]|nr:hypothetical protein EOD07_07495 [Mesorhizobium sp. M2C.T.Ca.TU.002.02.1.1]
MDRWESTLLKQASAHGYRFLKMPRREALTPTSRKINATKSLSAMKYKPSRRIPVDFAGGSCHIFAVLIRLCLLVGVGIPPIGDVWAGKGPLESHVGAI